MGTRAALIAGAALVTAFAAVAFLLHARAAQEHQLAVARNNFVKLNAAHTSVSAMNLKFLGYFRDLDHAYTIADNDSNKRHDESDSLTAEQIYDLARDELKHVGLAQTLSTEIDALDQSELAVYAQLYGEGVVSNLRAVMSERNEAREDGYNMWWRAAQSIEDNAKDNLDDVGGTGSSNDEITRDYDESTKDLTHSDQLQLGVDRESNLLWQRLDREWLAAKRQLKK